MREQPGQAASQTAQAGNQAAQVTSQVGQVPGSTPPEPVQLPEVEKEIRSLTVPLVVLVTVDPVGELTGT